MKKCAFRDKSTDVGHARRVPISDRLEAAGIFNPFLTSFDPLALALTLTLTLEGQKRQRCHARTRTGRRDSDEDEMNLTSGRLAHNFLPSH